MTERVRIPVVVAVMARRELIRFVRQPARIAGAIGTPCLLWVFMAGGFAEAFRPEHLGGDVGYAAFLLPGMMTLVAVFGATFSSLALIEDRNEGWLYAALVSPAPSWSIALGRIAGGAIVTWAQSAVLLALAIPLGIHVGLTAALLSLAALAVTSVGVTGLGLAFAWRTETAGGFHAVMNLVFVPMWLLSGALFPVAGAASWLAWVTAVNPLTWCTQAVRGPLLGNVAPWPLAASSLFALAAVSAAIGVVTTPRK